MNKILASTLIALLCLSFAAGLVGVWQIKPTQATTLFSDGFEPDASAWSGVAGTATVSAVQQHNGDNSLKADADGAYAYKTLSTSTAYVRCYFYLDSIQDNCDSRLLQVWGSGNRLVMLSVKRAYVGESWGIYFVCTVRLAGGSNEGSGYIGSPISLDTWYLVEVFFQKSTLTGAGFYFDETSIWNVTGTTANNDADQLNAGWPYLEGASTIYIDDVQVSDVYNGAATDISGPKYSDFSVNSTVQTTACKFSVLAYDFTNVSKYVFSTNNTGHFVNDTVVAFSEFETSHSAWANVTKTLNNTLGVKVGYRWYANDTLDIWSSSATSYLTVTADNPPSFGSIQPDTLYAGDTYLMVTCQISDDVGVSKWAYAWNNTGSWVNSSKVAASGLTYTANFYGTWNATVGKKVGIQFWANDSKNQATYSPLQNFVLVAEPYLKYRIFTNVTSTYRRNSAGVIDASGTSLAVINNAITACNVAGFGNISIYKGTYTIAGTINMKSNVDIYLRNGTLIDNTANSRITYWLNVENSSLMATNNATIRGAGTAGYDQEQAFHFYNISHVTIGATKDHGLTVYRIGGSWLTTDAGVNAVDYCIFQNIYAYDWMQMGLYAWHGALLDGVTNTQFLNLHIDGGDNGYSRSCLCIGGTMTASSNITITGGIYENSAEDNGIYLGGWSYPLTDIHITNVTTHHNSWELRGHSGIKIRPACNVTVLEWTSIEDEYGVEMGTAYINASGEYSTYLGGGSWYNYVEGTINSPVKAGIILSLDGDDKGQAVKSNTFNVEVNNCTQQNGMWIDNGYSTGGGSISLNTIYINATGNNRAGVCLSDSTYGPVNDNVFYCRFVDNGAAGMPDIWALSLAQQADNLFYVYSTSGNPNGLMNFVNGTNGNIVYYPYTGTRSLEILWHTVSTTVVGAVCDFSAYWVGDIGLSFGWLCTNISGVMVNQTAIALTSYADTFVDSATLPLVVGEGVAYIFYANDTGGLTQISATFFLTTTPIPHYYFSWNFKDRDNSNVNSILTYALYDGIIPVPYVKGVANLTAGTYTLVVFYYGYYVNDTALDTATQGNTTVNIPLEMKHHTIITNGYLVFDEAVTSLVINEQTHYNLTFTVTTTSTNIYIRVPANASFFTIDGTNRTYGGLWTYDDANGVILVDGGYTTYQIGLESWSAPNVSLTQFIIIVFLALGLLGFAPLILVALVLQKKIEPVPVILMITIMVITFAVLYLVVANLMNVV